MITAVGTVAAIVGVIAPATVEPLGKWARNIGQSLQK
jgi:hypothetical protein